MNNKLSFYLNVLLAVAVAILYYLHFSTAKEAISEETVEETDSTKTEELVILKPKDIKSSKIVYVNVDVLTEKYQMLKDAEKVVISKQQQLEKEYQTKAQKFQQDAMSFQQKMNSGQVSDNEAMAMQKILQDKKAELEKLDYRMQELMEKTQKKNEEIRQSVIDYLKEYNKNSKYDYIFTYTDSPLGIIWLANDSLDITSEVLDGLNANYKEGKNKK